MKVIEKYSFDGHPPSTDQVVGCMTTKPKILERKTAVSRVIEKVLAFVETFEDDLGEV